MSLLPLLFSNWWEELDRPHHVQDQHFGLGLHPEHLSIVPTDIFEPRPPHPAAALLRHPHHHARRSPSTHSHYYRPWGELMRRESGGGLSTVKSDKENFQVVLDVQQFAPEEITVKVSYMCIFVYWFWASKARRPLPTVDASFVRDAWADIFQNTGREFCRVQFCKQANIFILFLCCLAFWNTPRLVVLYVKNRKCR